MSRMPTATHHSMILFAASDPPCTTSSLALLWLLVVGKGTFTAAVEVQEQQHLVVSFLHHQPVQRLSHNPLERQDVVGVTNYLDVGLQASHFQQEQPSSCLNHTQQTVHWRLGQTSMLCTCLQSS